MVKKLASFGVTTCTVRQLTWKIRIINPIKGWKGKYKIIELGMFKISFNKKIIDLKTALIET